MSDVYLEMTDAKGYMRGWEGHDHKERRYSLSLVGNGESLLDVGCGGGITYEAIKEIQKEDSNRKIRYKGVDYSVKFIDACKEMFPEAEWEVQDALRLKERRRSWDVVYLRNILEHCPYYTTPIREAFRVARRLVVMTLWQPLQSGDNVVQVGERTWGNHYDKDRFYRFLKTFKVKIDFSYIHVDSLPGGRALSRFVYCLKKKEKVYYARQ